MKWVRFAGFVLAVGHSPYSFGVDIIVTSDGDTIDFGGVQQVADLPGSDGVVTLREAILASNNSPGPDSITFDDAYRIVVTDAPLPAIVDDETSLLGQRDGDGVHLISIVDALGMGDRRGIRIESDFNVVRDLAIVFGTCVQLGNNATGNTITGCRFGPAPDSGDPGSNVGVLLHDGATDNVVGGSEPELSNEFINILGAGVHLQGAQTTNNRISGNSFGYAPLTLAPALEGPNEFGVSISTGATANVIGGSGEGNTFFYSMREAITINFAPGNSVADNQIGSIVGPSQSFGLSIVSSSNTFVGFNQIISCAASGIVVHQSDESEIRENGIGDSVDENGGDGIQIGNCVGVRIIENRIGGNCENGIFLGSGVVGTRITNNVIGDTLAGGEGNGGNGIRLQPGASENVIGGTVPTEMNIIGANGGYGVSIGNGANMNSVRFNQFVDNETGDMLVENGANGGIAPPASVSYRPDRITGLAEPGDIVDLYEFNRLSLNWVAAVVAGDDFHFEFRVSLRDEVRTIAVTATDRSDNTSKFVYACRNNCAPDPPDPDPMEGCSGSSTGDRDTQTARVADALAVLGTCAWFARRSRGRHRRTPDGAISRRNSV